MVFVDKEGTKFHASVGEQLIKQFEGKLTEGDAKVVQLFKLYDAIGDYRTTVHPYKIGFFQTNFVGTADEFPSEVLEKYFADARYVNLIFRLFQFNISTISMTKLIDLSNNVNPSKCLQN
ncbi:hypothetical protein IGI04_037492 [Brassica rapa subsp. trilocularis]|uniref:Replication protein A 70 kDa DNA-binding subunit B/D first OB fold domain-containing protein n=1 Tax=Brassica rapa subsp. trilocularis TaxID=1813537 RepID=A0ABQ7LIE8_BRACM|nr:hypothetical protein IGI04_037492 [Brassica rapa subsp. trilocularis]